MKSITGTIVSSLLTTLVFIAKTITNKNTQTTPSTQDSAPTAILGTLISLTTLVNNTWGFALASTSVVGVNNNLDASNANPSLF